MTAPVRLQLSRRKGFRLQDVSFETNGLWAVSVARPSKWGNPYRVWPEAKAAGTVVGTRRGAVDAFRADLANWPESTLRGLRSELRGKNLACWCKLGEPCHVDVLLDIANS